MKAKLMFMVQEAGTAFGTIAQFISDGFAFVAELKECSIEDFIKDKEYEVSVHFFCQDIYGIFEDEEDYYKNETGMSSESNIPVGAFNPTPEEKGWKPSPFNLINSKVIEIKDSSRINKFLPGKVSLFIGKVNGKEIEQSIYWQKKETAKDVKIGNIVSGIYWAELKLVERKSVEC